MCSSVVPHGEDTVRGHDVHVRIEPERCVKPLQQRDGAGLAIRHRRARPQRHDDEAHARAVAELRPGGRAFLIGTEDYVGTCDAVTEARAAYEASRGLGFSPYATEASAGQRVACYWPF